MLNYEEVPSDLITGKDLDYLVDIFAWNIEALKKTENAVDMVDDEEIVTVLDDKPVFGSDLFSLAGFMKKTWGGPIGQILFSLVPPQAFFKVNLPEPLAPMHFSSADLTFTAEQEKIFENKPTEENI